MSDKKIPEPPPPRLLPRTINGGIAGIIGVSVTFPLDLVKTRLQNQVIGPNGEKQYKSMFDCFKKTFAKEGFLGMYRGSAVNILLVTPEKSIKLTANDMFRYYLKLKDGSLPVFRQVLAGCMAGACQIVITTPMELLKIQMQDAGRHVEHHKPGGQEKRLTALALAKRLVAERGIAGLYKGLSSTAARDITFSAVYFPLFAEIAHLGIDRSVPGSTPSFRWALVSGCLSGAMASTVVTPLDVIKTRMQTITKGSGDKQYTSWLDCARKTFQHEGITAFFKGGACRVIVVAPLFGIAQSVYYLGIAERVFGL